MDNIKYRNEIKYVCNEQQLKIIEHRIQKLCRRDSHVGEHQTYQVRSVYFDDYYDSCYRENESGLNEREKFRIRIYDCDMSYITLECKRKQNGKNHKFSCRLTQEQCMAILRGEYEMDEKDLPLLRKLFLQTRLRQLKPKVIVQYDRTPFVYGPGNVRITFDRNISGSTNIMEFANPGLSVRPIMPTGQHILEVKYDEFFPEFIRGQMQIDSLHQTSYSKYYNCRKLCKGK